MRTSTSIIASGLVLSVILISTAFVALIVTPPRGQPSTSTLVASTRSATTNSTELTIRLSYPNDTRVFAGEMYAGSIESQLFKKEYVFSAINPGEYALNLTGVPKVYFPSTTVKVLPGLNSLNITVYQWEVFYIEETPNLSINNTQPGPAIKVENGTVVTIVIHNNTTLIHNFAVVSILYDTNYSSVLFNSLSNTVSAGGSVNDTFVVTNIGSFYYECLIGNHARDGEYGSFQVLRS